MKEQKVYDILGKLHDISKEKGEDATKDGYRLLQFIYHDVYKELKSVHGRDELKRIKEELAIFLDGEESILTYFDELCDNGKGIFNEFNDFVDGYFKIIDNGYYESEDFEPMSIMFNIYVWLKYFHENKDTSHGLNLQKMKEDFSPLLEGTALREQFLCLSKDTKLAEKKKFIDKLLSMNGFFCVPEVRDLFKRCFSQIGENVESTYDYSEKYGDILDKVNEIVSDYDSIQTPPFGKKFPFPNKITSCCFEGYPITDVDSCNVLYNKDFYYCKTLLFSERFDYINTNLLKHITNKSLRNEFMNKLSTVDNSLFDYFNKGYSSNVDTFIKCMDIIFDSDSYYEVNSKLNLLIEASETYLKGEGNKAETLVNGLIDAKHKKEFEGLVLSYDRFNNMVVDKPESILDRTLQLLKQICEAPSIMDDLKTLDGLDFSSFEDFDKMFGVSWLSFKYAFSDWDEGKKEESDVKNENELDNNDSQTLISSDLELESNDNKNLKKSLVIFRKK